MVSFELGRVEEFGRFRFGSGLGKGIRSARVQFPLYLTVNSLPPQSCLLASP